MGLGLCAGHHNIINQDYVVSHPILTDGGEEGGNEGTREKERERDESKTTNGGERERKRKVHLQLENVSFSLV